MNEADRHDEVLAAANALNAAFAYAVDHHRLEELRGVLAENVEYVSGDHRLRGLEAVVARFAGRIAPRTTRHVPGPALVLADNGARVRTISVWTCFAAHTAAPSHGPVRPFSVADFNDTLEHTPGGWRIASRHIDFVFRDPDLAPRD
jgi:SnoaL-like domain